MTTRTKAALIALVIAALVGLVFSGLLYYKSVALAAGLNDSISCDVGSYSCDHALRSQYSKVAGIPTTAASAAFYFSIIGVLLGLFFAKDKREEQMLPAARYFVFTYALSVLYSAYLGYIAFVVLPIPCPFCIALYVANAGGLTAAMFMGPKLGEFFKSVGSNLGRFLSSRVVHSGVLVFAVGLVVLAYSYQWAVAQSRSQSQAESRKKGEEAAEEFSEPGDTIVPLDGLPRLGKPDATVTIVEFSDFECPFCEIFSQSIHQVHEAYPNDVAIYFVNFPLDESCNRRSSGLHASACFAAQGATCAQEQGDFWEMHDKLFEFFAAERDEGRKPVLTEESMLTFAADIGMDPEAFLGCLNSDYSKDKVVAQIELGFDAHLRSTPTWVINGHIRTGGHPFAYIKPQIDRLLELARGAAPPEKGAEAEPAKAGRGGQPVEAAPKARAVEGAPEAQPAEPAEADPEPQPAP